MALDWSGLSGIAQPATSGYGAADSSFVLAATPADGGYFAIPSGMDGETLHYYAQNVTDDEREIGSGVYTHSSRLLARADANITLSTNSNNRVAFTAMPVIVIDWTGELFRILDLLLNITGAGTAAGARTALGVADSDINTLVNARIAAMQSSGALPRDPAALEDGTLIQVSGGAYIALT